MRNLKKILVCIFLSWTLFGYSQNYSLSTRSAVNTGVEMTIEVPTTITTSGLNLGLDDRINFYYDSSGVKVLAGSELWNNTNTKISIYGNSSLPPFLEDDKLGYNEGEELVIKIFDNSSKCLLEGTNLDLSSDLNIFRTNDTDTILSWEGRKSLIVYPRLTICRSSSESILPIISGKVANLIFSNTTGLGLDSITGEIMATNSAPGLHWVKFNTITCLEQDSILIEILDFDGTISFPNPERICGAQSSSIKPEISGSFDDLKFLADSRISLDSITGEIIPDQSVLGPHIIFVSTNKCISSDSILVRIIPASGSVSSGKSFFCKKDEEYYEALATNIGIDAKFSSLNPEFEINEENGGFRPSDNPVGNFQVKVTSTNCLANSIYEVRITDNLVKVNYPPAVCSNEDTVIVPEINGVSTGISFSASPNGLSIDENDGSIDVNSSGPSNYTISLLSDDCLESSSFIFSILRPNKYAIDSFKVTPSSCIEGSLGSIIRDFKGNPSSAPRYFADLFTEEGTFIKTSEQGKAIFDELESGDYKLEISEFLGVCRQSFHFSVDTIPCPYQNINDGLAVIDFQSENGYDKIRLNCQGIITIYNRNSKLVKTLDDSFSWDGRDNNDKPLPTGLYIIFCDNKRLGEVTIISH